MRMSEYRHSRQLAMTRANLAIWEALTPLGLSDLEVLQVLAQVQLNLVGRMVATEHREADQ